MNTRMSAAVTTLVLCGALISCGGIAQAPTSGGSAPAPMPSLVPSAVTPPFPTAVPTPGSTATQTQGPLTWNVWQAPGMVADVVSTGTLLVAVGIAGISSEGETTGAWTSPDGRTWEPAILTQPADGMHAVAVGPGGLVAVGGRAVFESTLGPAASTSVDGRTWQALPASAFAGADGYEAELLSDIAAGPGGFVVVGSERDLGGSRPAAWYSSDGRAWTRSKSTLAAESVGVVVRRGTGYVAAGWSPGDEGDAWAVFWTSPDGRSWTAAPDAEALHGIGSTPRVAATPQHVVAVGYPSHQWAVTDPLVWTSQDAVTWVRQSEPGLVAPLPEVPDPESGLAVAGGLGIGGLIAVDGGFMASGGAYLIGPGAAGSSPRRVVWKSATGAHWTIAAELPPLPVTPDSERVLVGTLVEHRGRLLVFGSTGGEPAPLWETDLQTLLDRSRDVTEDSASTTVP